MDRSKRTVDRNDQQWKVSCAVEYLESDEQLAYTGATEKGQSGSPVYRMNGNTALVVGIHTGPDATKLKNIATWIPKHLPQSKY